MDWGDQVKSTLFSCFSKLTIPPTLTIPTQVVAVFAKSMLVEALYYGNSLREMILNCLNWLLIIIEHSFV